MRSFNISGPCDPVKHYMLPAEPRLPGARQLVEQELFFVVHAPRQTGKTTSLVALTRDLGAAGYAAVLFSCEAAGTADDVGETEDLILNEIRLAAADALPPEAQPPVPWPDAPPGARLRQALTDWARACPKPLVLLFDEIDALTGRPLLSVLRQLRSGYNGRPLGTPFLTSAVLCGMRDVRDYRMAEGRDPDRFASSSPFNVSAGSFRLADFTAEQVAELYGQHTADTGQAFTPEAVQAAFECTAGQPWLVNSIAKEIITGMGVPVTETITAGHVEQARRRLILARATHLDSLAARLDEPRIRRVIDPLLAAGTSEGEASDAFDDDLQYVRDLGLVAASDPVRIASPMYRDIIVRTIAGRIATQIRVKPTRFRRPDGSLDFPKLVDSFGDFWVRNGAEMAAREEYHHSSVQLVLHAYLQILVNGGGLIDREVSLGTGIADLVVRWYYGAGQEQEEVIELKVWYQHHDKEDPLEAALIQLDGYLDSARLHSGTVIIFDRRDNAPPLASRTVTSQVTSKAGHAVTLLRA